MDKKIYGWLTLLTIIFASCNKDFSNKLDFGSDVVLGDMKASQHKVAYIVVEGAVGTVVGTEATDYGAMPNLGDMTQHSMFSWNAISSSHEELATDYADLLTGAEYTKHQVLNSSLVGNNLEDYPVFFKRMKASGVKSALITSNTEVAAMVGNDADTKNIVATDEDVLNQSITELNKSDASIVMMTFGDVKKAGDTYGYGPDVAEYLNALTAFDEKVGVILKTIESRPNYKEEKWLIVIASTNGGEYVLGPGMDDQTVYSITSRNNFVLFYNKDFAYKLVEKANVNDPSWDSQAVTYVSNSSAANQIYGSMGDEKSKTYNIQNGKEYTISFKIKILQFGTLNVTLMGNRSSTSGSELGWAFLTGDNPSAGNSSGSFRFKVGGNSAYYSQVLTTGVWYSVSARIFMSGTTQKATIFVNGVEGGTIDIANGAGIGSSNFKMGFGAGYYGGTQRHMIADLRFYDVAIPVNYILANGCSTMSTQFSDTYRDHLIGYWPANDGGSILLDRSPKGNDFLLGGNYAWTSFSEKGSAGICPTLPKSAEATVIRSIDVPLMIYNWYGLGQTSAFDLDAQSWLPIYSNQ